MKLAESDGQSLICAADTFFDPRSQSCVRNPFMTAEDRKRQQERNSQMITYRNELVGTNQYEMIIESLADSPMFLSAAPHQPAVDIRWKVDKDELAVKALESVSSS